MPSLLATCETLFGTRDLYLVLGLEKKTANSSQIKKAYHKVRRYSI
jgi:DnaJ-class molecular chaperone